MLNTVGGPVVAEPIQLPYIGNVPYSHGPIFFTLNVILKGVTPKKYPIYGEIPFIYVYLM